MAMSAMFYSYAGNSASTAYAAPPTTWWDEKRIVATVSRNYISSRLPENQRARIDESLAFGDGLTTETYSEWIRRRAKRLFLILLDIGAAHEIFRLIDESLDDDDLPLPVKTLEAMELAQEKDAALAKKFYKRQFTYMLRAPAAGDHIQYAPDEVVPVEPVHKLPNLSPGQPSEKVTISTRPGRVYVRRRIPLGKEEGQMSEVRFIHEVSAMKAVSHQHVTSIFATYTHQDGAFVLLTPASEMSLRSFLQIPPPHFRALPKQERRQIVLTWLHCLAEGLTFIHDKGLAHGEIQPSNITIDSTNNIALGVPASFRKLRTDRRPNTLESYEYGPPECWAGMPPRTPPTSILRRKPSRATAKRWKLSVQSAPTPITESFDVASSGDCSPVSTASWPMRSTPFHQHLPPPPAQKGDIFGLACVYLDMVTFLLKKKLGTFASHRSANARAKKSAWGASSSSSTSTSSSAVPADSSFHANPDRVDEWMDLLRKDSFRRKEGVYDGVPPMLAMCAAMLSRNPAQRPEAWEVAERVADILCGICHFDTLHCGMEAADGAGSWDFCCESGGSGARGLGGSRSRGSSRASEGEWRAGWGARDGQGWELPALPALPMVADYGVAY